MITVVRGCCGISLWLQSCSRPKEIWFGNPATEKMVRMRIACLPQGIWVGGFGQLNETLTLFKIQRKISLPQDWTKQAVFKTLKMVQKFAFSRISTKGARNQRSWEKEKICGDDVKLYTLLKTEDPEIDTLTGRTSLNIGNIWEYPLAYWTELPWLLTYHVSKFPHGRMPADPPSLWKCTLVFSPSLNALCRPWYQTDGPILRPQWVRVLVCGISKITVVLHDVHNVLNTFSPRSLLGSVEKKLWVGLR